MNSFDIINPESFKNYSLKPVIFGVSGSPRRDGNSNTLLSSFISGAAESLINSNTVRLIDYQYQSCLGCENCRRDKICTGLKDGMSLLYPKILESKGLVLVSPTHNYNITAWMKAFIDRLYCFYNFDFNNRSIWSSQLAGQGRKAVIAAVCEQNDKDDMGFTMEAMRRPLQALGYDVVGELPVYGVFGRGRVKKQDEVLNRAIELGKELAESLIK
jgi:multimeric flavodoxin WrbA